MSFRAPTPKRCNTLGYIALFVSAWIVTIAVLGLGLVMGGLK